jgi:hypothetical protein
MPKITMQVERSGQPGQMTLSERIVAAHLTDDHYAAQLLERLIWAAADAEALESQADSAEAIVPPPTSSRRRLRHERSRQMPDARKSVERSSDDPARRARPDQGQHG